MKYIIKKDKTAAVTGHRILSGDLDRELLNNTFTELIERGYECFLCGMALGFDSVCFDILENLREIYGIKIIACIPCKNQEKYWSIEQKIRYKERVAAADGKVVFSEEYTNTCMYMRNEYMVKNCSVLIAYLHKDRGGTFYTVNKAKDQGKQIILV